MNEDAIKQIDSIAIPGGTLHRANDDSCDYFHVPGYCSKCDNVAEWHDNTTYGPPRLCEDCATQVIIAMAIAGTLDVRKFTKTEE